MTSKNLFFNLMKEDFKRRLWVFTVSCLTFLLSLVLVTAINISLNINREYGMMFDDSNHVDPIAMRNAQIVVDFSKIVSDQNIFLGTFFLILALVVGISGFRYVQKKKSVDFFHSIPVKREKLFLVTVVNSLLMVAVPYLASAFIAAVLVLINTGEFSVFLTVIYSFAYYIPLFAFAYMTVVLGTLLTGNVVLAVLGSGILTFYIPVGVSVIMWYMTEFFKTAYIDEEYIMQALGNSSSFLLIYPISDISDYTRMFIGLAGALVFGVISLYVYKFRASESAGKSMSFKVTKAPIKMLVVILLSVLVAMMFYMSMDESIGWAIFGIIISSLISHCAFEAIYNSDFKKLFDNLGHLLICVVISVLFFLTFRFDWTGYDRYVPSESTLESGAVYSVVLEENWNSYARTLKERDNYAYYYESNDLRARILKRMNIKNKELLLKLSKRLTEKIKSGEYEYDYYYDKAIIISYKLKGGGRKLRKYNVGWKDVEDILSEIYADADYKKGMYPILETEASDIVSFDYNSAYITSNSGFSYEETEGDKHVKITDNKLGVELVEAYKSELLELTTEDRKKEYPIAAIRFNNRESEEVLKEYVKVAKKRKDSSGYNIPNVYEEIGYYPIYPKFKKTIEILKKMGVYEELGFDSKDIEAVNIYLHDTYYEVGRVSFNKPKQVDELVGLVINAELPYSNIEYLNNNEERLFGVGFVPYNSIELNKNLYIKKSVLPDFAKERLEENE